MSDYPRYDTVLDMVFPPLGKRVYHSEFMSEIATRIPDNSWKRENPEKFVEAARNNFV